jgi:hypothetical protein
MPDRAEAQYCKMKNAKCRGWKLARRLALVLRRALASRRRLMTTERTSDRFGVAATAARD